MFKNKSDIEVILILMTILLLCGIFSSFIYTKIKEDKSGEINNMNTFTIDSNADNGYNEETDSIELYLNNKDHTKISIPISELIDKDLIHVEEK